MRLKFANLCCKYVICLLKKREKLKVMRGGSDETCAGERISGQKCIMTIQHSVNAFQRRKLTPDVGSGA